MLIAGEKEPGVVFLKQGDTWKRLGGEPVTLGWTAVVPHGIAVTTIRDVGADAVQGTIDVSLFTCTWDAGCSRQTTSLALPSGKSLDPELTAAVPIGDGVLLVWAREGIRMRLATVADLGAASDTVLLDTDTQAGDQLVHRVHAYAVGDGAILVFHLNAGMSALRVDAAGKLTSVAVVE